MHAVETISFDLERGETMGLVGESGSGKSTVANALMRLEQPTSGTLLMDGKDLTHVKGRELKALRRRIAMVFQDPFSALNPRQTVGASVAEPLVVHGLCTCVAARWRSRRAPPSFRSPLSWAKTIWQRVSGPRRYAR